MKLSMIELYDKDMARATTEDDIDRILRSKYLYCYRGQNISTVNNKDFDKWASMIKASMKLPKHDIGSIL